MIRLHGALDRTRGMVSMMVSLAVSICDQGLRDSFISHFVAFGSEWRVGVRVRVRVRVRTRGRPAVGV